MRQKDQAALAPLRMLKAALMNREVEKGRALDDAESLQVVNALVKQRRDSIEQFRAGGRQDLADREQAEIVFLATLPAARGRRGGDCRGHRRRGDGNRRSGSERHGQGHEGRHGETGGPDG